MARYNLRDCNADSNKIDFEKFVLVLINILYIFINIFDLCERRDTKAQSLTENAIIVGSISTWEKVFLLLPPPGNKFNHRFRFHRSTRNARNTISQTFEK